MKRVQLPMSKIVLEKGLSFSMYQKANYFHLLFFILFLIYFTGCSTHHYSYIADKSTIIKQPDHILGLPVIYNGLTPNRECINYNEKEIDEQLIPESCTDRRRN